MNRKNELRDPFDQPAQMATDRVLSIVALVVGAVALAIHNGPLMIGCGVVALIMGVLGLTFGNW